MMQSDLLRSIREYFWRQKFTEIEIPYLNPSLPLEANIYAFESNWTHQNTSYFLPTSPEFALKKHLAQNPESCFSISHCFRDLEDSGPHHSPEFLMLEWYEVNKNLQDLMLSTKKFVNHFLKIDFITLVLPENVPQNEADFNQFFLNEIEATLPQDQAVFITGYPAFLSPLAQTCKTATIKNAATIKQSELNVFSARSERVTRSGQPEGSEDCKKYLTSDRFELYINGIEIANGCVENRDPVSIKNAFEAEKTYRQKHHLPLHPISLDFIQNSASLPLCSGIGLGLDRFLGIINS